jgi:hypothetical protein
MASRVVVNYSIARGYSMNPPDEVFLKRAAERQVVGCASQQRAQ